MLKILLPLVFTIAYSSASLAKNEPQGEAIQTKSEIENTLKAFAYDWYGRFDRQVPVEELKTNLPENQIEFIFPQTTIKQRDAFLSQVKTYREHAEYGIHDIEEITVHKGTTENTYTLLTPHTYFTKSKGKSASEVSIASRMTVQYELGKTPVITGYKVVYQDAKNVVDFSKARKLKPDNISHSDVKSFVHQWFALADKKDAHGLTSMVAKGNLGINLLGNKIASSGDLFKYLTANANAQKWASHTPINIKVINTPEGFKVSFLIHFKSDITGMGEITMNNTTTWLLVNENNKLRLRDYSLTLL